MASSTRTAKEIFSCFETALLSYTRAADEEHNVIMAGKDPSARPPCAPIATRLATRLCLLLATATEVLTKGRELEVAGLLASASSHESSLGAAVLLEQASGKYAFHMLLSGHMFRTANQDHHASRCCTCIRTLHLPTWQIGRTTQSSSQIRLGRPTLFDGTHVSRITLVCRIGQFRQRPDHHCKRRNLRWESAVRSEKEFPGLAPK